MYFRDGCQSLCPIAVCLLQRVFQGRLCQSLCPIAVCLLQRVMKGRLSVSLWTSPKLTVKTTMAVHNACVVSILMYGSETWTTYAKQEKRLNSFHLRSIRRILGISWRDRVSNANVLSQVNLPSMFTLLRQRRLRWLGHVYRMGDGCIPKDILWGELAYGRRTKGRTKVRYKDVCKRDMKALDIKTESWEDLAADRMRWRSTLNQHLKSGEEKQNAEVGQRVRRKDRNNSNRPGTTHRCDPPQRNES